MPTFLKHVGQVTSTGKKCVVVFRTIPGDENSCLVVETESLKQLYHDDLQKAVESIGAQETVDFYTYAQRTMFHDGTNMLEGLHQKGWLRKLDSSDVTMLPTNEIKIQLNELNLQLGKLNLEDDASRTTSGDISRNVAEPVQESKPAGVLDDQQIANNMRQQAAQFRAEAERLLKEAEELSPTAKATKEKVTADGTAEKPKAKRAYNRKK